MNDKDDNPFIADWPRGRFQRSRTESLGDAGRRVSVVVAGDWAPGPEQEQVLLANADAFYGGIAELFKGADLSAVNLEMPVSSTGARIVKDGPDLALGAKVVAAGLGSLGCSLACLANNHIMDYGVEGLSATLNALREADIQTIGAGWDWNEAGQPFLANLDGHRIALLNVAEGEEAKASAESPGAAVLDVLKVKSQIRELAQSSDAVIVIVHAGREFIPIPPPYIRETYRALADAGASIVIGHHPHVPQGIELWNGVPIVYSLGHFVFWVNPMLWSRSVGYFVSLEISESDLIALQVHPYEIGRTGLTLLEGERYSGFLAELEAISQRIASPFLEEFWNAYADLWSEYRLPEELLSFALLMSWKDWADAIGHRMEMEAQETGVLYRFFRRGVRRSLRMMAARLPARRTVDPRIAAVVRNRFDAPAHSELYKTAFGRSVTGVAGDSAPWARELLEKWEVAEWQAYH
jgi:poly-gamma-glutamate capsule biosynthesis protein CapA/YwtB (metallophosphatase superfamily)